MGKLDTMKNVVKVAVSIGVGAVMGNAIHATSPNDMKALSKLAVMLGGAVLGSMISDKAADYTEEKIDEATEMAKNAIKESLKEQKE